VPCNLTGHAEDNAINQRVTVQMLRKLGCRSDLATNGREAVDVAPSTACDLILMHCDMPELDGCAATLQIRERESRERHIPIVAPTANAVQQDRDKCFAPGLDDYPAKPVSRDALRPVLERGYSGVTSPAASEAQPSNDRVAQL
jgi:CheY-like chemotaxis protein